MNDGGDPSGTIFTLFYLDIVIMFSVSDRTPLTLMDTHISFPYPLC